MAMFGKLSPWPAGASRAVIVRASAALTPRGRAPRGGRGRAFPDLHLVSRFRVLHEDPAPAGGVREQAPVGRPGRVEVRAPRLRLDAIDAVGLEVEDEHVEDP